MAEVRYNNSLGQLGAPMASTDTSITFTGSPGWATLASGDFIKLEIDPPVSTNPEPNPLFEIVYVTAYTAGASTGTITRAQEGTAPSNHAVNATWIQGMTAADLEGALSPVTSWNGRTGAVVPASGDYTAAEVTNAGDKSASATQVFTGDVEAPALVASGLTGATAASRYVGATASGAPTAGTFAVGDYVVDQTGAMWVCTAAGTPGTWVKIGASSSGVTSFNTRTGAVVPANADYLAVASGGLTGATAATRYVGGTTSGAPATGTFAVGDFIVDRTGLIWICTAAGTPGTWVSVSSAASYYQTIEVNGTAETQRGKLNLIPGTNVTISAVDNSGANSTDVTISASGGSGSGSALPPARAAAGYNVTSLSGLGAIDGYTPVAGDLILLLAQSTASQNGLWTAASGAWTRPSSFPSGGTTFAVTCAVMRGSSLGGANFVLDTDAALTIDTSAQIWKQVIGLSNSDAAATLNNVNQQVFVGGMVSSISGAIGGTQSIITSLPARFQTKTSAYTAVGGDFVSADGTTAAFNVTLPALPSVGTLVTVQKVDSSANAITVLPQNTGSINGSSSYAITSQYAGAILEFKGQSAGSDLWVVTAVLAAGSGSGLPSGGSVGQVVTNTGSGTGDWEWPFSSFIRVSDHGAKGDCRFGSQCTTTANNTTVTVTDGSLTSADVGKAIVINGACNGTGGGSWATTISSVTNSTTCVVASAPTKAVSNLSWAIGTDDTTAFNNAITAGQALGVGRWTLLLDDVAYMIAGSLVTTNNYNTQIPLPYVTSTASRVTIEIRGKSTRPSPNLATGSSNWTNSATGPVLFCSQTNQTVLSGSPYSSSVGVQSMIAGPASAGPAGLGTFTQVAAIFRGITFVGPHWPAAVMTDMGCVQQATFEDCLWATNESQSQASPGWRTNAACIMPLNNNNGSCELKGVNAAINQAIGFVLAEHTRADKLTVFQAQGGIAFPTWQSQSAPAHIAHAYTQSCVYHVTGWDPGNAALYGINTGCSASLDVDLWGIEGLSSGTYVTSQHVNCGTGFYMDAKFIDNDLGASGIFIQSNNTRLINLALSRGPQSAPTVPSSGAAFPVYYRDTMYVFTTNWANVSSATIAGTPVGLAAGQDPAIIYVPSGMGLVLTYSSTKPTLAGFVVL